VSGLDAVTLFSVALVAGAVRGLSGFAGPLIMVPVLSFFYDPVSVIGTTSLVDVSCNIALFRDAVRQASLATVAKIIVGALISIPLGARVLLGFDTHAVMQAIYAAVALFSIVLIAGWRYNRPLSTLVLVGVGAINGLIVGATSFGVAMLPFLYVGPQSTVQSRANFILWALFTGAAGFGVVAVGGRVGHTELLRAVILAPIYIAGTVLGNLYSKRIDSILLRRIVLVLLLTVSLAGLAAQIASGVISHSERHLVGAGDNFSGS